MVNIYCDESCHLPNDNSPVMVIGGISCPENKVRDVNEKIREIKKNYGVFEFAEIKWTKVSNSKLQMYKDLVDYFFDQSFLLFRAVVATQKEKIIPAKFGLSYDDWYQRIYYQVLNKMVCAGNKYAIYVDIKDTKGIEKVETLKDVLNRSLKDFYSQTILRIQLLRSDQVQIMQLSDLLIGAICYKNRNLNTSPSRLELINYIEQKAGASLSKTSRLKEDKFNIFIWKPKEMDI